jgi:membrane protease YdiL (CAAX protease family)
MKYLIPLCIVWSQVKMPAKVAMPMPIRSGWAAWAALGTFFIGFFAVSIFQLFVPMDIFMDHTIGDNFKVMDYMDTGCQTALLVVYLLISPILAEILLHGALFQVLRQFGAGFASLVVALLSAALSHDPVFFPTVFIISLVAGYGTWQSGSILTAIVVRICGKVVFYLMLQSGGFPSFGSLSGQVWFSLAVLLTGLVIGAFLLLFRKRRRTLRDRHTFLPTKTKAKMAALSTPMLVAWGGCLIMLALEVLS